MNLVSSPAIFRVAPGGGIHSVVVHALRPSDEAQRSQDLRLDLQSRVEVVRYIEYAERHARYCPEEHHTCVQAWGISFPFSFRHHSQPSQYKFRAMGLTSRMVPAVVDDNLGDELDGPAHLQ
jgi:hypothetical protein